jgi:hypothetical protein
MPPSDIDIPIAAAAPIHPQRQYHQIKRSTVSRNCSNGNKGNTENGLEQPPRLLPMITGTTRMTSPVTGNPRSSIPIFFYL